MWATSSGKANTAWSKASRICSNGTALKSASALPSRFSSVRCAHFQQKPYTPIHPFFALVQPHVFRLFRNWWRNQKWQMIVMSNGPILRSVLLILLPLNLFEKTRTTYISSCISGKRHCNAIEIILFIHFDTHLGICSFNQQNRFNDFSRLPVCTQFTLYIHVYECIQSEMLLNWNNLLPRVDYRGH